MSDKIIVTNISVLTNKYGAEGVALIRKQVASLAAADKARGITTSLIALDDPADMKPYGPPVTKPGDPKRNKSAVDSIFAKATPDYLVILGATDVVPHQDLVNPVYDPGSDDDPEALGDLPYACDKPYSRKIRDFLGPTRVVGRLPDLNGASDPDYLIDLLKKAASYKSLARPKDYFGLTADVWTKSTELSLGALFGNHSSMFISPPKGPSYTKAELSPQAHFVNCHGAPADPKFYGQESNNYPDAMDSSKLDGVRDGTVAAFECCYGAELYDPMAAGGTMGIANRYLAEGAYGLIGSTTIAYGPADRNSDADLICRYFLRKVLGGASLGRAMLEARLDFVQAAGTLSPIELKTLAQFILLGDPSIHPFTPPSESVIELVRAKVEGKMSFTVAPSEAGVGVGESRSERRMKLARQGAAVKAVAGYAEAPSKDKLPPAMLKFLVAQLGTPQAKPKLHSFAVSRPKATFFTAETAKISRAASSRQHVLIQPLPDTGLPFRPLVGLVAHEIDGRIIVTKFVRR